MIYGRRRVGKRELIMEYIKNKFLQNIGMDILKSLNWGLFCYWGHPTLSYGNGAST